MKKENMNNMYNAGHIQKELAEIEKMQKSPDSFLTLWSNTCADYYTIICC